MPHDVVIVDDDPDILEIVAEALREEGYRVATFAEATGALAYVRDHPPALVLTDMLLPPIGGGELVTRLRALHGEQVPVVVMSAMADRERLAGLDVNGILNKPFELEELSSMIRRWIAPEAS